MGPPNGSNSCMPGQPPQDEWRTARTARRRRCVAQHRFTAHRTEGTQAQRAKRSWPCSHVHGGTFIQLALEHAVVALVRVHVPAAAPERIERVGRCMWLAARGIERGPKPRTQHACSPDHGTSRVASPPPRQLTPQTQSPPRAGTAGPPYCPASRRPPPASRGRRGGAEARLDEHRRSARGRRAVQAGAAAEAAHAAAAGPPRPLPPAVLAWCA